MTKKYAFILLITAMLFALSATSALASGTITSACATVTCNSYTFTAHGTIIDGTSHEICYRIELNTGYITPFNTTNNEGGACADCDCFTFYAANTNPKTGSSTPFTVTVVKPLPVALIGTNIHPLPLQNGQPNSIAWFTGDGSADISVGPASFSCPLSTCNGKKDDDYWDKIGCGPKVVPACCEFSDKDDHTFENWNHWH